MNKLLLRVKILFIPSAENEYKPRFLESDILFHYILALLILKLIAISFIFYFPKTVFFADLTKTTLIELTNQERQTLGLPVLKENSKLNQAAYQKAQDMLFFDYFSHYSPSGISPWYWFKKAGYNYQLAGENLAIGFLDSEEVVGVWKKSPPHRQNLLNPNFQEIGTAVLKGDFQGSETTVVVQVFGSPMKEVKKVAKEELKEKPEVTPPIVKKEVLPEGPLAAGVEDDTHPTTLPPLAGPSEFQLTAHQPEIEEPSFKFNFLRFMTLTYPNILQKIIFYSLILVMLVFALNVFIKIQVQDKRLIFRTTTFIALLILFAITDKELIIQLIPHNLLI